MNRDRTSVAIFLHIPKTAGSTLRTIVYRQYPPEAVCKFYDPQDNHRRSREELIERLKTSDPPPRLVIGHMGFGIHECLDRPFSYFTMLRDPIDRAISTYYFIRRYSPHPLHAQSQQQSLDEFVRSHETVDNSMTRFLSGVKYDSQLSQRQLVPPGQCSREMLDRAKQNLKQYCKVVGLVERFDESLLLFKQAFGWDNIYYISENVSQNRPRRKEISAEMLRQVELANELDLELYQYGKSLFNAQIERQERDFELRLRAFELLNQGYQFYHPLQQQIGDRARPLIRGIKNRVKSWVKR